MANYSCKNFSFTA